MPAACAGDVPSGPGAMGSERSAYDTIGPMLYYREANLS